VYLYLCNVRIKTQNISEDEREEEEIRLISNSTALENIQGQKDSEGTWSPHRLGMLEAQEGRRVTPVLNSDPRPHFGWKPSEHVQSSNLHAPQWSA